MSETVTRFLCLVLSLYYYILIIRIILSWFPRLPEGARPIAGVIYAMTDPLLRLVRPLIPPVRLGAAALDLSPLLVFFLLSILRFAVC